MGIAKKYQNIYPAGDSLKNLKNIPPFWDLWDFFKKPGGLSVFWLKHAPRIFFQVFNLKNMVTLSKI